MLREKKKFPKHLANMRLCSCVVCGVVPSEACHIRFSSAEYNKVNPGVGSKPADFWTISLCSWHHRLAPDSQHETGDELAFWNRHGIDPLAVASQLWEARDNLEKMIEICQQLTPPKEG